MPDTIKQYTKTQSIEEIKKLLGQKKALKWDDFTPGHVIFTGYNAKHKERVFDKTPFILVLKTNFHYTLGINFHWLPMNLRLKLIKYIVSINKDRIKKGKKTLMFDYKKHKAFLKNHGYMPVVRLYINNRYSKQGVKIPPERFMEIAPISSESFTGIPEYKLYRLAKRKKI